MTKFSVGDVVRVVHHFDHRFRPDASVDAQMTGDLRAVVAKVSEDGGSGIGNGYELQFVGDGETARKLPPFPGDSGSEPTVFTNAHSRGSTQAWWNESCLALVSRCPVWEKGAE